MSVHRSLRATKTMERHRSVLNRLERLRALMAKGTWRQGQSPFGLPKVKHVKVTVKKEKAATAAPAVEGAPAASAAPVATPAAAAATPAKADAAKPKKG